MSTHAVPADAEPQIAYLIAEQLRMATAYSDGVYTFEPDLTLAEEAKLADLIAVAQSGLRMTSDQYDAVRTQMQTLRDLRQMGRNAFMGLSQAERDRALYDAFTATTQVFLAILRG